MALLSFKTNVHFLHYNQTHVPRPRPSLRTIVSSKMAGDDSVEAMETESLPSMSNHNGKTKEKDTKFLNLPWYVLFLMKHVLFLVIILTFYYCFRLCLVFD